MRCLVVGAGPIGRRHLSNLSVVGINTLAVADPEPERREAASRSVGCEAFDDLEGALAWDPDIVVIASPSHLHVQQALLASRQDCDLFVEKPLSHRATGLGALAAEVERRELVSLVGCNMRFHPGPAKVKGLLEQAAIGGVLFARVHTGSYLPEWRPGQDYRTSYSALAAQGGGCLLDCIHEVDLTRWYLGRIERVFCLARKRSTLEVDVEDVASLICEHESGVVSEIRLDYVQRTYERGWQIAGAGGSIFWDYGSGVVRWYRAADKSWHIYRQPEDWERNRMYLDEMRHFLSCVRDRLPTTLPVRDAVGVMESVFAAKRSSRTGRMVEVTPIERAPI